MAESQVFLDRPKEPRVGFEPSVHRRGGAHSSCRARTGAVLTLESRIDDGRALHSRASILPPKAPRDRAKSCHLPPHRSIDSHLGKIAFAPLCQQCAMAIVPALLRGQHHHWEKRVLGEDIKEVNAEAEGTGFEPKIMRQILKIRKMDKDEHDEQESLLDIYKRALGMLPDAGETAQAAE